MTAVGTAAPAAMSTVPLGVGISLILLDTVEGLYAVVAATTPFNSMLHYGTVRERAQTLMVVVPILTALGIMRQNHGFHTAFETHGGLADTLFPTTSIPAIRVVFLALGFWVLRRQNYADDHRRGSGASAGSYALICPGVAPCVMLQFWLNKSLVGRRRTRARWR